MESHLKETKKLFKSAIITIAGERGNRYDLAEAAFPAYANRNPLIDRIFWGRLKAAERYVLMNRAHDVLDFGSGSGVMTYCLTCDGCTVTGVDTVMAPLEEIRRHIAFPPSAKFMPPEALEVPQYDRAFDAIIALDVLEHIDDLTAFVALAKRVLKPSGVIVVSGPTENVLYHLGRKLAGKQFTGDYHVSNVGRIRERLAQDFLIEPIVTIYPWLPLFELFAARMRVA
jgi:2-polyprenyl-3-methyl-5-hydroxy-6-metoxy-1,4-benzoquinol methylase